MYRCSSDEMWSEEAEGQIELMGSEDGAGLSSVVSIYSESRALWKYESEQTCYEWEWSTLFSVYNWTTCV